MNILREIAAHLTQKPNIPPKMEEYCANQVNKINQGRFKNLSLLFIVAVSVILLIYVYEIIRYGAGTVSMAYIVVDAAFLVFVLTCRILLSTVPFFKGKGFAPMFYATCCMIFSWTIVLSVLDNNVTSLIIALLLLPVGFIIKPRVFIILLAFMALPTTLAVSFLRMEGFSLLTNAINTFLSVFVSAYICRVTYNLIMENFANIEAVEFKNAELHQLAAQLKTLSEIDPLTSLLNRRKFNEVMDAEWDRAIKSASNLVVIILDIDYFKNYNDTYGHIKGDECLALVGLTLRENFKRSTEYTARYGGEEFAVILTDAEEAAGIKACERLISAIAALKIPHIKSKVANIVTVCAGIAMASPREGNVWEDLLRKADAALYIAKRAGRNRYAVAAEDILLNDGLL